DAALAGHGRAPRRRCVEAERRDGPDPGHRNAFHARTLVTVPRVVPPLLHANANFRRYFIGQSISLLGDQVSLIALPLTAVLVLHASAAQMGALTTAYLVPNLLLALHVGVW